MCFRFIYTYVRARVCVCVSKKIGSVVSVVLPRETLINLIKM